MIDYERRGSGDPRRFRLSINPEILRDGKEDSYERNPGGVSQGELPHSGKREWPGSFVFNHKFF